MRRKHSCAKTGLENRWHNGGFNIPVPLRRWKVDSLPVSVRLQNTLDKLGIDSLGQLHGKTSDDLLGVWHCGKLTVEELKAFFDDAASGRFRRFDPSAAKAQPADLIPLLDELVGMLDAKDRRFLVMRLGGLNDIPQTLQRIGSQLDCTREFVRQINEQALDFVRRVGGGQLSQLLDQLVRSVRPIQTAVTAEDLARFAGKSWNKGRYAPGFYWRLAGFLHKGVGLPKRIAKRSRHR